MRALSGDDFGRAAPPAVWRAETGFCHDPDTSAADVIRFEQEAHGRALGLGAALLAALDEYPASALLWVTATRDDALRYAPAENVAQLRLDIPAFVIATDDNGGLLLFFPDDITQPTGGAVMAENFTDHERGEAFLHRLDAAIAASDGEQQRNLLSFKEALGDEHPEVGGPEHPAAIGQDLRTVSGFMKWEHRAETIAPLLVQDTSRAVDDDEEQKRRAGRGGGDMGNPAHATLSANIRPDVGNGPGGLETYTTQKSADYAADPEQKISDYFAERRAEAESRANPPTLEREESTPAANPYLDEIIQGIKEGSAPDAPRYSPSQGAQASLHYDLARDLAALPAQIHKPPYATAAAGLIDPYTVAAWIVDPADEAAVQAWADSPVAAAKLRDAVPEHGYDPQPADVPNDQRPHPLPYLSLADLENPWNAVVMPLHSDAEPLLRAGALHAACYCAVGEYQLMRQVRNGEYEPPYYDASHPDEIGMHEYAENAWQQAEKKVNEILLFDYRDLATLQATEGVYSDVAEKLGVDLDDPANVALLYRQQSVGDLEGFLEEREEALTVMQQNDQSTKRQNAELSARNGETPSSDVEASISDYFASRKSEAKAERESDGAELAELDHGTDKTPGGGGGRGIF